jgi:hypothetical protein
VLAHLLHNNRSVHWGDAEAKAPPLKEPALRDLDVSVEIHAIGINSGEAFIRRTRSAEPGGRVLLGWEFAGVVVRAGSAVRNFKVGNRVFGTGDMSRDGAWAERVAVDHRILAKVPDKLSFADAASLPIGAITSWEAMFRDQDVLPADVDRVLIVEVRGQSARSQPRTDSAMLPRTDPAAWFILGQSLAKGSALYGLTSANDLAFVFQCRSGPTWVLRRPIECTALIGA